MANSKIAFLTVRYIQITFFTFVAIFEIGSLVCGVAPSSTALIIGRAVAGIGGSGLFNGALTIVAAASPKENRARMKSFSYFTNF